MLLLLAGAGQVFAEDQERHAHQGKGGAAVFRAAVLDEPGRFEVLAPAQLHVAVSTRPSLSMQRGRLRGPDYNLKH